MQIHFILMIFDNSGRMVPSVAHDGTAHSAQMAPVVVEGPPKA